MKQQFLKAIRKAAVLTTKTNSQKQILSPLSPGFRPNYVSSSSAVSSPDSGLPQLVVPRNARLLNGLYPTGSANPAGANGGLHPPVGSVNINNNNLKRPVSYHSSQSDPGYGSNGELQRRI